MKALGLYIYTHTGIFRKLRISKKLNVKDITAVPANRILNSYLNFNMEKAEITVAYLPDGFTHVEGTDLDNGYTIQDSKENKYVCIDNEEKLYFQVAYSLENDKVQERAFGAFKEIEDNCPKYVLSLDRTDFSRDVIIHKNIIDWLLEK